MTEFEADRGKFKGWKKNRPEGRARLLNGLLDLIIEHVQSVIGFVAFPDVSGGVKRAYGQSVVDAITIFARDIGQSENDPLSFVFAKHPEIFGQQDCGAL